MWNLSVKYVSEKLAKVLKQKMFEMIPIDDFWGMIFNWLCESFNDVIRLL